MRYVTFDPRASERKRMSREDVRANLRVAADKSEPWIADGLDALCLIAFAIVGAAWLALLADAVGRHVQ